MFKEMRDKRKVANHKSGKNEDEQSEFNQTIQDEKKKYDEIMARINNFKSKTHEEGGDMNVAI
jgi:hypothetical protein